MSKRFEVVAGLDEIGEVEVLTWDLFPVVDARKTLHLDTNGLPKIGTRITPGMVIIGKIGQTKDTPKKERSFWGYPPPGPTTLEIHSLSFEELHARFGHMWRDTSLYADSQTTGVVREAYLEDYQGTTRAVVVLEEESPSGS